MYLIELVFAFSLDIYPAVKFLDYMVVVFLVSLRSLHTFSHSGCAKLHSYQQCTVSDSFYSTSLLTFVSFG